MAYLRSCMYSYGIFSFFDEEEFEGGFGYVPVIAYIGFGIIAFSHMLRQLLGQEG